MAADPAEAAHRWLQAAEEAQLLAWIGKSQAALARLDAITSTEHDRALFTAAMDALDERDRVVRETRKVLAAERRAQRAAADADEEGRSLTAAYARELVAKKLAMSNIRSGPVASLLSTAALVRGLMRRLETTPPGPHAREQRAEPGVNAPRPGRIGDFTTLALRIGEARHEVRMVALERAHDPLQGVDLDRLDALLAAQGTGGRLRRGERADAYFPLYVPGGIGEFFFRSRGVGSALLTVHQPDAMAKLLALGTGFLETR